MNEATVSSSREVELLELERRMEEDIIFGRLAPGTRLVKDTLMARYGASRHYVRQALAQLERAGIVLRERNVGATVRSYSPEEVAQIYEVREMLTRQAALKIVLPAPPDSWNACGPSRPSIAGMRANSTCTACMRRTMPSISPCSRPAATRIWSRHYRTTWG